MRNWLEGQSQRVVVSSSMFRWRPVTSSVLQGSVLGPLRFNVFINDKDDGIEYTLSKFADDKLSSAVDMTEGRDAIQKVLNKLKRRTHVSLMRFNKAMGQGNPGYIYRVGEELTDSSLAEDLGACSPEGQQYPGLHQKRGGRRVREGTVPVYSALVEAPRRVLCPGQGPPAQERQRTVGEGPEEGHEDDLRAGAPLLQQQTEEAWLVQSGEGSGDTSLWPSRI